MQLYLVNGRHDPGLGDDAIQVGRLEVRHSRGAQPALGHQLRHGFPGRDVVAVIQCGKRPVDQEEIELVKAEVLEGLLEGTPHVVPPVVAVSELACDV